MKRASTILAWLATLVVAALAALNWNALRATAPVNLGFAQVDLPLGLALAAVVGALAALFFVAYLQQTIGSLLETRRLLREMQRVQELADKAEASRLERLQQTVSDEFRRVNVRLDALGAPQADDGSTIRAARDDRPASAGTLAPPAW